jgi:hypothetical protein
MTSSSARRAGVVLCTALVLATGQPAWAQAASAPSAQALETARTLYKEGKDLRAQGDVKGALEKLRAAHALGNTPITGLELARTYVMLGQLVEAREVCLGIARTPVAPDETDRSAEARNEAAKLAEELKPRIATIVVKITGLVGNEPVKVVVDRVRLPDAAVGEALRVNPGAHTIGVTGGAATTERSSEASVEVAEGQTQEVTVTLPEPPFAPPEDQAQIAEPPPTKDRPQVRSSPLVPVGFTVAVVGVGVGAIAGIIALSKKSSLDSECNGAKQCDHSNAGANDLSAAQTAGTVSTVGFVVGGAGLAVGLIGLLTRPDDTPSITTRSRLEPSRVRMSPWIGVGSAGVHGAF